MASICAHYIFYSDIWRLINRTKGRCIQFEDMGPLSSDLYSKTLAEQLDSAFKTSLGGSPGSRLRRALWKCFRWRFLLTGILLFISDASKLALALTLRLFLLSDSTSTQLLSGMGLIFLVWIEFLFSSWYEAAWRDVGNRSRISIRGLMFRRLLTKTKAKDDGRLINMLTGDLDTILFSHRSPYYLLVAPVCFVALLISITVLYDWDALVGIPIVFAFVFIGSRCAQRSQMNLRPAFQIRDLRLNALQQSINGIYTIKASQMEQAVLQLVTSYRVRELWHLLRHNLYEAFKNSLIYVIKFPVITVVVAVYLLVHSGALTASYIFPLALLYQFLQDICSQNVADLVTQLLELKFCTNRVANFIEPSSEIEKKIFNEEVVKKITTDIIQKPGKFYQIFGKTGSGKTTFAESLLMTLSNTKLNVAFCAQKPWLINATVRENILCGRSFDYDRFWKTISACQLSADLNKFREGDQTQVGENGVKLSGGQRARVAIARAVYSDADVYIFDDPFKSLNSTVSSHVFKAVFTNLLKQKTRILIGSKYHMSPKNCDQLYRLKREEGLEELVEMNRLHDSDLKQSSNDEMQVQPEDALAILSENQLTSKCAVSDGDDRMTHEKEKLLRKNNHKRSSRLKTVRNFFRYFSFAPIWLRCITLVLMLLGQLATNLSDVWLYFWVVCTEACDQWFYFKIYAGISVIAVLLCIFRSLFFRYLCHTAAKNIQNQVIKNIIHAPMEFYWNADSGEVLNMFSTDTFLLDIKIPLFMDLAIHSIIAVLGFIITIGCMYPIVFVFVLPALLMIIVIEELSVRLGQETQMYVAESVAPIVQKFSSVAEGLVTIRAFRLENYVQSSLFKLIDRNSIFFLSYMRAKMFLVSGAALIFASLISILIIAVIIWGGSSAAAGLVLYYSIQLIVRCQIAVYCTNSLDLFMVHFYRLLGYMAIKKELHSSINAFGSQNQFYADGTKCRKGQKTTALTNLLMIGIEADQVGVQYKGCHNWAIKNKNLTIKGGKITGIAGRTGCGKSTFLSAMLRMVSFEGTIRVGKRDSRSFSLAELRGCFSMLPQDSMIFYQETVRWNLDPYKRCSEDSIWDALDVLGIKHVITRLPLGLQTLLKGAELSSGETRLFCFARVVLNSQGKILLLDEPTDSVDFETEKKIWEAIRNRLQDQTIIVVAHSRNLLKRCDQIIQFTDE